MDVSKKPPALENKPGILENKPGIMENKLGIPENKPGILLKNKPLTTSKKRVSWIDGNLATSAENRAKLVKIHEIPSFGRGLKVTQGRTQEPNLVPVPSTSNATLKPTQKPGFPFTTVTRKPGLKIIFLIP